VRGGDSGSSSFFAYIGGTSLVVKSLCGGRTPVPRITPTEKGEDSSSLLKIERRKRGGQTFSIPLAKRGEIRNFSYIISAWQPSIRREETSMDTLGSNSVKPPAKLCWKKRKLAPPLSLGEDVTPRHVLTTGRRETCIFLIG